jgi:hypothetical protein
MVYGKELLVVVLTGTVLLGCTPARQEEPLTIRFEMVDFRLESEPGCSSDSSPCAFYQVTYPKFYKLESAVNVSLQRRMDATVSMGNPEAEGKSMKEIGDDFISNYREFELEMPDLATHWFYEAEITVEVITDSLLSLAVHEEYYTGGAHGGHGTYFISVNPQTGAEFVLDNLLKPGYNATLTKLGEGVFRRVHEIPDSVSLEANGFEFADDLFHLNQNYGFKKEGIVFYYNSYEIASYAAGPTEVLIPYKDLRDWLR